MAVKVERLQAPSSGINTDASPDYVGATEAPGLVNFLPGLTGKIAVRGRIVSAAGSLSAVGSRPDAFWSFDDFILVKGDSGGGTKTRRMSVETMAAATDVTATLVKSPLDYRYARFGANVYGAIVDANQPALGKWDGGATAIVLQTNAPFQWTDLQVHAQRLFILGGSVPGTTTPVNARSLYWTDPGGTADLSLLASWQDDVSGLTNQLSYQSDDTPVGLAGCGQYMAIVGSRSINILTGTGSASFAVRNLTRNLGCKDRNSIIEVDDGFYFMSDRGFCFCDGSTVQIVSDPKTFIGLGLLAGVITTAMFNDAYLAIAGDVQGACWLFHIPTRSWTQVVLDISTTRPTSVFRTNQYPIIWQSGGLRRAETITRPSNSSAGDSDGVATFTTVRSSWTSRFVKLAGPGQMSQLRRILIDYAYHGVAPGTAAWHIQVRDSLGTLLIDATTPPDNTSDRRLRYQVECGSAEADAIQLTISNDTAVDGTSFGEIYDVTIEYEPGRNRPTI